jgi:hypothetical protein
MKYKMFQKIIGNNSKKYDGKKWDAYVKQDEMCFKIPPILFLVMLAVSIILFVLGLNGYGYISVALGLFFLGRYLYKINGACKASKK